MKNKAQKWVFAALVELRTAFPFPILGIDSDNGSEFINGHLLAYRQDQQLTFTRSRSGNKNDGAQVEQKNWSVVRNAVGYHRYDTADELSLLNQINAVLRTADELLQEEGNLAMRRTAARPAGVPGQCLVTASLPARLVANRRAITTTRASST